MKLSELHYMELLYETRQSIAAKDVNLVYYLKDIERRLTAGEEAVKKVEGLNSQIESLQQCNKELTDRNNKWVSKVAELENEVERLKQHPQLEGWEIDLTTGVPILTFEKCSVIQDEQAYLVMQLLCKPDEIKKMKELKQQATAGQKYKAFWEWSREADHQLFEIDYQQSKEAGKHISVNRSHEECGDCSKRKIEPPTCKGHVSGPSSCKQFEKEQKYDINNIIDMD